MIILKKRDCLLVKKMSLIADYDRDILVNLYQPIVGFEAISVYFTLLSCYKSNCKQVTFNHEELFLLMGNISASNFVESRRKLEGIGLLKTYKNDEGLYTYCLYAPKSPQLFFDNALLFGLLIKSVGEQLALKIKNVYVSNPSNNGQELTSSFKEVFNPNFDEKCYLNAIINTQGIMGRSSAKLITDFSYEKFFDYLKNSTNITEKSFNKKDMKEIERLALLYGLSESSLAEKVAIVFNNDAIKGKRIDFEKLNNLLIDEVSYKRILGNNKTKNNKPSLVSSNTDLANKINIMESTSPRDFLSMLQNGTPPITSDLYLINDLSKKYNLSNAVINVIIDYVLTINNNVLSRAYVEKIASSVIRTKLETAADTMNYLIETSKRKKGYNSGIISKKSESSENAENKTPTNDNLPSWDEMVKDLEGE